MPTSAGVRESRQCRQHGRPVSVAHMRTAGRTKDSPDLAPFGSPAAAGFPWCYRPHRLDLGIPVLDILLIGVDRGQKLNVIRAVNSSRRNGGHTVAPCFGDAVIIVDHVEEPG